MDTHIFDMLAEHAPAHSVSKAKSRIAVFERANLRLCISFVMRAGGVHTEISQSISISAVLPECMCDHYKESKRQGQKHAQQAHWNTKRCGRSKWGASWIVRKEIRSLQQQSLLDRAVLY